MATASAAAQAVEPEYGMVDDPLAEVTQGPALELASVAPPARFSAPKPAADRVATEAESPEADSPGRTSGERGSRSQDSATEEASEAPARRPPTRAHRIAEVAGYGPPPRSVLHIVPYAVRVFMRRRVVEVELADLARMRKEAEREHHEAMCAVGQTLYLRRAAPELAALARHAAIVADTESQLDQGQARSADAQRDATGLLETLHGRLRAAEEAARPVVERKARLEAKIEQVQLRIQTAQQVVRASDQKAAKLRARKTPEPQNAQHLASLEADRDEAAGHARALGQKLGPLTSELDKTTESLARHRAGITKLESQCARQTTLLDRERARHVRAAGDARHALEAALKSLAQAALDAGLTETVNREAASVERVAKELERKRKREAFHREALGSYDQHAYRNGMTALVGGTGALFLAVMLLIVL